MTSGRPPRRLPPWRRSSARPGAAASAEGPGRSGLGDFCGGPCCTVTRGPPVAVTGAPGQGQMRRRRPGVTAAATTAVFATGCTLGVATAAPTTAAFATGARTTPTRPTRAALSTISCSSRFERLIGLERGDDRLDRDPPVGHQLATGASGGGREGSRPEVLVHEDPGDAAGTHRHGQLLDVVHGQQLGELSFDRHEVAEVAEIGELHRIHGAGL